MNQENPHVSHFVTELSGNLLYALTAHALGEEFKLRKVVCSKLKAEPSTGYDTVVSYDLHIKSPTTYEYEKPDIEALKKEVMKELKPYLRSLYQEFELNWVIHLHAGPHTAVKCTGSSEVEVLFRTFCLFKLGVRCTLFTGSQT